MHIFNTHMGPFRIYKILLFFLSAFALLVLFFHLSKHVEKSQFENLSTVFKVRNDAIKHFCTKMYGNYPQPLDWQIFGKMNEFNFSKHHLPMLFVHKAEKFMFCM